MSCIVRGCPNEGVNKLGIRLRRPDTTAVWAPNIGGVCEAHSAMYPRIEITYTPTKYDYLVIQIEGESPRRNGGRTFYPGKDREDA